MKNTSPKNSNRISKDFFLRWVQDGGFTMRAVCFGSRAVCVAVIALAIPGECTWGQANPFAPDAAFTAPTAPPSAVSGNVSNPNTAPAPDETNLVVLSIRSRPPKTPEEFARALIQLNRIGRFDEMARLLDQLAAAPLTEEQAAAMVKEIGAAGWFAIRATADRFNANQSQVIEGVLRSAAAASRNEQVLSAHYTALRSGTLAEQKRALLGIQAAGADGLAYLIATSMNDAAGPNSAILATLQGFGPQGTQALRAALMLDHESKRERLIALTAQNTRGEFLAEIHSFALGKVSPSTRDLAVSVLAHLGAESLTADSFVRTIQQQLEIQLRRYHEIRKSVPQLQVERWQLIMPDERLKTSIADESTTVLDRCGQLAKCLLRVTAPDSAAGQFASVVLLEYQMQLDGQIASAEPLRVIGSELPSDAALLDWEASCLATAERFDLPGAQLRLVQRLQSVAPAELFTSTKLMKQLTAQIRSSSLAVRANTAMVLGPLIRFQPYAGSERTAQVLQEMSQLEARPLTLIIGSNSEVRGHARQLVDLLGGRALEVANARDAIQALEQPNPIERILIVYRVREIGLGELTDRCRQHFRGKSVPLAVLANDLTLGESALLAEMDDIVVSNMPASIETMAFVLERIQSLVNPLPITANDRAVWQAVAGELATASSESP